MEDRMFELMTKMYSDITGRLDTIDDRLGTIDDRLDTMDKKLDNKADKSDIVRIENKLDNDSKALFDGYKLTYEKLQVLETKVDSISQEIEKQDVELKVLKGGK